MSLPQEAVDSRSSSGGAVSGVEGGLVELKNASANGARDVRSDGPVQELRGIRQNVRKQLV